MLADKIRNSGGTEVATQFTVTLGQAVDLSDETGFYNSFVGGVGFGSIVPLVVGDFAQRLSGALQSNFLARIRHDITDSTVRLDVDSDVNLTSTYIERIEFGSGENVTLQGEDASFTTSNGTAENSANGHEWVWSSVTLSEWQVSDVGDDRVITVYTR